MVRETCDSRIAKQLICRRTFLAARALVADRCKEDRETGRLTTFFMADRAYFPVPRGTGHGVPGQSLKVHRLRCRFHLHRRRANTFSSTKKFTNDPKRCKQCKAKRASGGARVRPETRTSCSECGSETTVPTHSRPPRRGGQYSAGRKLQKLKPAVLPAWELYMKAGMKRRSPLNSARLPTLRHVVLFSLRSLR